MEAYGVPFDHMDEHWTLRQQSILIQVRNARAARDQEASRVAELTGGRRAGAKRENGNAWMMAGRPPEIRALHEKHGITLTS